MSKAVIVLMILTNIGWEIPLIKSNPFDTILKCNVARKAIIKYNLRKYNGKYFHDVGCFILSSHHYARVEEHDGKK